MQDFYRSEEGMMTVAREVANMACHKLVADILYRRASRPTVITNVASKK